LQPAGELADRGAGRAAGEIGRDDGVRDVEPAAGVAPVPLLGDRERDDADGGVREPGGELLGVPGGVEDLADLADDAQRGAGGVRVPGRRTGSPAAAAGRRRWPSAG
jgi:hypothetical protein